MNNTAANIVVNGVITTSFFSVRKIVICHIRENNGALRAESDCDYIIYVL